jgi:CRISPR-associated protein Cas1
LRSPWQPRQASLLNIGGISGGLKEFSILSQTILTLEYLVDKIAKSENIEKIIGYEGAGAASYFAAYGKIITNPDFVFIARSRRPPGNPVNAMLSFGYQVLWNHLLALIELQQLDPYLIR